MALGDVEQLTWMRNLLLTPGAARHLRTGADLSQQDVAAAMGVSREAVARWENGQRTPRGPKALRYARLLRRLQDRGSA